MLIDDQSYKCIIHFFIMGLFSSKPTENIKASITSVIINDGLSDIENNQNPYGVARRLVEEILAYDYRSIPYSSQSWDESNLYYAAKSYDKKRLARYIDVSDIIPQRITVYYDNRCEPYERGWGLQGAAEGNHRELVDYFLFTNVPGHWGLEGAAEGNHRDLIDYLVGRGITNWGDGLCGAAKGNHRELVDWFIEKGANRVRDLNEALDYAALGGHADMCEYLISRGANEWNWGLTASTEGNHKQLIKIFMEKGANNLEYCLMVAKREGHKDLVKFFEDKLKIESV